MMKISNLKRHFLSVVLLFGLLNISTQAFANIDTWNGTVLRPYSGAGSADDPMLISSAEEFAFLLQNYDYNNGVCYKKYYKLTCDIDMSACLWTYGIATTDNKSFRARFDGDGHKISNVHIVVSDHQAEQNIGIFPQLGGDDEFLSGIENLEIDNIIIEFQNKDFVGKKQFNIGGLVGNMYRNSFINNCIVNGMTVSDKGATISLSGKDKIRIGSLVGTTRNTFNEPAESLVTPKNVDILNSYGHAEASFTSTRGAKDNYNLALEQGSQYTGKRNGFTWYKKKNNKVSFFPASVKISETPVDASGRHFHAEVADGGNARIRWAADGKELRSSNNECTVAFDVKDRTISCELIDISGNVIASDAVLVQPDNLNLTIDASKNGQAYTLRANIIGQGANALGSDYQFEWYDMNNNENVVGTNATLAGAQPNHTYQLVATHKRWRFCLLSAYYSLTQPIFVCYNGIGKDDAAKYTIDGVSQYPAGKDTNDGLAPERAVRTLSRAYSLLKGNSTASNIIVIMGDYPQNVFNTLDATYFTKNKKATIIGQYGNIANGSLAMYANDCVIDEDTRFDNLILRGDDPVTGTLTIMAQEHNITMGHGMQIDNYTQFGAGSGLIGGTNAPNVTIYGGFKDFTQTAYTHKANKIRVLSGYYGRIIAGGRNSRVNTTTGNVLGTPDNPIRTTIEIDICNNLNPHSYTFDVALAIAGQGNGSCFAVTSIDIMGSSRVGRTIGGNLGYGRKTWIINADGSKSDRPTDSFFGQSVINIKGGNVNEVYGANLARSGKLINPTEDVNDSVASYFYGKSIINISGGQIRTTIYGAGGGGVTGLAYNETYHTNDPYIPYIINGSLEYGPYAKARRKLPRVKVSADSVINLNKTSVAINISGDARLRGSVYGGGHGYSNEVYTSMASSQAGNLYGNCEVNVTGGSVDGYIYGGGRGSTSYFDNNDLTDYPVRNGIKQGATMFGRLAVVHGNTHVNITGGKIIGMVYAGGEGSYYRPLSANNPENATTMMASVVGNTHLNVGGNAIINDFVFGGGNYGNILSSNSDPKSGNTYVNIAGGKIMNSIFAGGHGYSDREHPERSCVAEIQGDAHVNISGGEFAWTPEPSRYDTVRYYGIFGSGLTASIVQGNTDVMVTKSLLSEKFMAEVGIANKDKNRTWDKYYVICGGGFGEMTDVMGTTNVEVNLREAERVMDIFGGGVDGNVEGSTHVTIKGKTMARNIYGGCLVGNTGLRDMSLNGSVYSHRDIVRDYDTRATIDFISGIAYRVFGGSLMGSVSGETFINIGTNNAALNNNISIHEVYGGSDVCGTIAGSNNSRYGTNINILGGTITGNVYGSGNGNFKHYDRPISEQDVSSLLNASTGQERPHVASTKIFITGQDKTHRANIQGTVYAGGNHTTVGLFVKAENDRPQYGILREELVSNSGSATITIGSYATINNIALSCRTDNLLQNIPSYTTNGLTWYLGFENDADFVNYCRTAELGNAAKLIYKAGSKAASTDVTITTVNDGSQKTTYSYTETEGNAVGTKRQYAM